MSANVAICPRCRGDGSSTLFLSRDYLSRRSFPILRCEACGHVYTEFSATVESISSFYPPSYHGEGGYRFLGVIESLIRLARWSRTRQILRLRPNPGRILDIGCGRGIMLAQLATRGWRCFGTEASDTLARAVRDRTGLEIHTGADVSRFGFEAGTFDVVTLWHVLEHLVKPFETLEEIHRLLAPTGLLVLETPNLESLQARWGRDRWFHLDAPRHLHHFSLHSLTTALEENGFRVLERKTLSLEYGPFGLLQTVLNRVCPNPNALFGWLKSPAATAGGGSGEIDGRGWQDALLTALLVAPVAAASLPIEIAAAARGAGAVARLVAERMAPE